MEIHILTLFPGMFQGPLDESMLNRARESGLLSVRLYNIRDYTEDLHRVTDDYTYGGGPGMLLKPEPIFAAMKAVQADVARRLGDAVAGAIPVILLSPRGRPFTQEVAQELGDYEALALICGHYEGVDARVEQHLATDSLSIGDYVLTGGELPAMVVVDAVARLLPGVLGDIGSAQDDSFTTGLLQEPQYTRPASFQGIDVPKVLLSGDHRAVAKWRRREALRHTWKRRPDLLENAGLTPAERAFLEALEHTSGQAGKE